MCDKTGFATRREASETIYWLRRNSSRTRIPRRTYYCRHCCLWHLTAETKGEYRDRRKWHVKKQAPGRTMRDRR